MLRRFTRIVAGMVVYPDRMLENLGRSRGVVFSGTLLLELARRGVIARAGVPVGAAQRDARVPRATRLQGTVLDDADVMGVLTREEIERAFDLGNQLRNVDAVIDRALAHA